ncbi:MAG: imidazole glycerol phosphate synthase subunit HisF [Rhodothermales bacterium]|nr:imidazole glycerol phosphate synthase subunit HisF [Rhodothermales bacterium]
MLTRRIIPCLDIKDGQTVKGVNFVNLRSAGDPVELAARYVDEGADELVFLDITATIEERAALRDLVRRIAEKINIPFTVGGGIREERDVHDLLRAGADKVSVNSAAVRDPGLVNRLAQNFGSQCIVLAIDARRTEVGGVVVHTHGGRRPTSIDAVQWAREVADRGAGEILLTSMDHDGTKNGFAVQLTGRISQAVRIPVIASGGAGSADHFATVFMEGHADAALAASIFHFGEVAIRDLKSHLRSRGIPVRL